jgi:hypothetical protein
MNFFPYVSALFVNAFGPMVHRFPDSIRINYFRVGPKPFVHVTHDCWFFCCPGYADQSAAVLQHVSLRPLRTRIIKDNRPSSFQSFHSFVNFPLTHTVIPILNCHSSVKFTSFHNLWPQKSDHRSLLFFGALYQWSSHVKRVTVLPLAKRQWKPTGRNEGRFTLFISVICFSAANTTFEVK